MRSCVAMVVLLAVADASADTFTVTSFADSGPGTLREALTTAISNDTWDSIEFASSGTVVLTSPLPAIVAPASCAVATCSLRINSQTNSVDVVIDGSNIPRPDPDGHGLRIFFSDVWVWDLTFAGFEHSGIWIDGADTHYVNVRDCRIGTNASGTTTSASTVVGDAAIRITGGAYQTYLYDNVIGGYVDRSGGVTRATGVTIDSNNLGERPQPIWLRGNIIGLTADGLAPLGGDGNAPEVGIHLHDTVRNQIGGQDQMNTIGNQSFAGILVTGNATANYIDHNRVGTDITGTVAMPNGFGDPDNGGGVVVDGGGASGSIYDSIISGNVGCQVRVTNAGFNSYLLNNIIGPAAGEPTMPLSTYNGGPFSGSSNGVCALNSDIQVTSNVIAYHTPALSCPPDCGAAVTIQGSSWMSHVSSNSIGVTLDGGVVTGAAPNHYGVLLLDGPDYTDIYDNTIAHQTQAGIAVVGSGSTRNEMQYNDLYDNGTDRTENVEICLAASLNDCVNHGYTAGTGRANLGVLPPTFDSELFTAPATVEPTAAVTITGTAAEGSVYLFRTPQPPATGGHGGSIERFGPIDLDSAPYEFSLDVTLSTDTEHCFTAIYTDPDQSSSEFAPNVRVKFGEPDPWGAGPCRPPWTTPEEDGGGPDGGDPMLGGDPAPGDPLRPSDSVVFGDASVPGGDEFVPGGDGTVIRSDGSPSSLPPCSPGFEREDGQCVRRLGCNSTGRAPAFALLLLALITARARPKRR